VTPCAIFYRVEEIGREADSSAFAFLENGLEQLRPSFFAGKCYEGLHNR
jgi:hypothetical protein